MDDLVNDVIKWADDRDLLHPKNAPKQFMKIAEEMGEMSRAYLKKDRFSLVDGIGDTLVTLIIFANQNGIHPRDALQAAYNEIKDRTGETVEGSFIKCQE